MALTATQLNNRAELYKRWKTVDTTIQEIIARGAQSASSGSGTGNEAYTALSLTDLINERASLARQIATIDRSGRPNIRRVGIAYNGGVQ